MSFPSLTASAIVGLALLSGCAAPSGFSLFAGGSTGEKPSAVALEEADVCPTPEACGAQLKKMISDPKRDWIGQTQTPAAYSNGTRLFAYRALRKKLTCGELDRAISEIKGATPSLQPVQYERVRNLSDVVARELKSEHGKRCTTPKKI